MNRRPPLVVGDQKIPLGQTRDVKLKFSESYLGSSVTIPVRVIRAKRPGPRVFLTGAVHGDELTGIGIIRELLYEALPPLLNGTLICCPVVNTYGLDHHSRYLPDRRDLNRCFPGSAEGSMSNRLAGVVFREIVSQCDLGLDFHSAAIRRTNYPNVRADMRNPEIRKLARAFGIELIVNSKGPKGSLRSSASANSVPTIILEAGEVWKIEPGVVETGVRGCLNVLKTYGMIPGEADPPIFQVTIEKTSWLRAERGGFLSFHAKPGDLVETGQPLATNYNIFGRERNILTAPQHSIILGMTTMPAVKPGDAIFHLATIPQRTFASIRSRIEQSGDESLFHRIRNDLSTNIVVSDRSAVTEPAG